jgi:plasmid stabilization system protein ParE
MARVVVTRVAKQDVRKIITYLNDRAGLGVARRYAADFKNAYALLRHFPNSGPPRKSLGPFARSKIIHPYVVIYDYADDMVMVLRVLHGHRKITVAMMERPRP